MKMAVSSAEDTKRRSINKNVFCVWAEVDTEKLHCQQGLWRPHLF